MEVSMKPFQEFEGKNVEIAVEKACAALQISKDKLKYDVISYGSTGIFGLVGIKKAKIRVSSTKTKPVSSKNKAAKSPGKADALSLVDEAFSDIKKEKPKPAVKPKPAFKEDKPKHDAPAKQAETTSAPVEEQPLKEISVSEEVIQTGYAALQKIVDLITDGAEITPVKKSDCLLYDIKGGNSAVLIGKRGQTLESIQYIVDKIVNKCSETRVRVQIDVEGYLDSRRESLEKLALRMAEKAKKTGKPATISQMTAHDRRIVHLALKDDRTIRTQSMGDGYYRRLVIFPKKYKKKKKQTN